MRVLSLVMVSAIVVAIAAACTPNDPLASDASVADAIEFADAMTPRDAAPMLCGNGLLDEGENCDLEIPQGTSGACPLPGDCVDNDDCTADSVRQAGSCGAICANVAITLPTDGDSCCQPGTNPAVDNDCTGTCGNGLVEAWEQCDTAASENACPLSCDDGVSCSADSMQNPGTCNATCTNIAITQPNHGDGCCLPGTNPAADNDCANTCGNGLLETWEQCDIAASGSAACPTSCDDGESCTAETLQSAGTCLATCLSTAITLPVHGDDCCQPGTNPASDNDCPSTCGNGIVETWEQCDISATGNGACPTSCDDGDTCTSDAVENVGTCNATCSNLAIILPADNDACCPSGSNSLVDNDCEPFPACTNDFSIGTSSDLVTQVTSANDHDGALWVFWNETDNVDYLRGRRLNPVTDAWDSEVSLGSTSDDITQLSTATDHDGALWIFWNEADLDSVDYLRGRRLNPSTDVWDSEVPIGNTFDGITQLSTATDHDGALWIFWNEADLDSVDYLRGRRLNPVTDVWDSEVPIGNTFDDITQLSTATDHAGVLWIFWNEADLESVDYLHGRRLNPITDVWDSEASISSTFDNITQISTATDHAGALWIFWNEADFDSVDYLYGRRLNPVAGVWDSEVSIGSTFDNITKIATGRDATRALWILWNETDLDSVDYLYGRRLNPVTNEWAGNTRLGAAFDDIRQISTANDESGAFWAFWNETDDVQGTSCGFW